MIKSLRKIITLDNLRPKGVLSRPRKSQIATLLVLMMVSVLILVMVTVNIGQASLTATNLANAADAGALYLASQLATQAQFMWRYLGNRTQRCEKKGIASIVFAATLALAASIITAGACAGPAWTMFAATVAGAAGGAIGGEYAGTGAGKGAIQGAAIGLAIGMGVSSGFQANQVTMGGNIVGSGSATLMTASGPTQTLITYSVAQGAVGASLAAGANIYNAYIGQRMFQEAYTTASRALNNLNEYDRYRESTFLQVFLQTIDDPNEEVDINDVDGDGERDDKILPFFIWWKERMDKLEAGLEDMTPILETFFKDLKDTVNLISVDQCLAWKKPQPGVWDFNICTSTKRSYLNLLSAPRQIFGGKKSIAEMLIGINNGLGSEYCTFFPDSLGYVIAELEDLSEAGNQLLTELASYGWPPIISSWGSWFPIFYDEEKEKGIYYELDRMLNNDNSDDSGFYGLRKWLKQLDEAEKTIKEDYPECEKYCPVRWEDGEKYIDYNRCFYTNSPCHLADGGCSVDSDLVDEIAESKAAIKEIIAGIEDFRIAINNCHYYVTRTYGGISLNPATYSWTDSRGDLSITVEAGPYKLAHIENSKHGNDLNRKVCATLWDYADDGRCWIRVSRKAPANSKDLGLLGKWDPAVKLEKGKEPEEEDKSFTITRTSKAYYSYDKVGISGISK